MGLRFQRLAYLVLIQGRYNEYIWLRGVLLIVCVNSSNGPSALTSELPTLHNFTRDSLNQLVSTR